MNNLMDELTESVSTELLGDQKMLRIWSYVERTVDSLTGAKTFLHGSYILHHDDSCHVTFSVDDAQHGYAVSLDKKERIINFDKLY